ncbi:hypothetical protein [Haloarchaeobius sp. TZWWS8]|uniref:hypothetical protein n=1 Tax=Haloarchaeobius sp. TZWWS8 TaxID=3446121 RepID=UPI003EBD555A
MGLFDLLAGLFDGGRDGGSGGAGRDGGRADAAATTGASQLDSDDFRDEAAAFVADNAEYEFDFSIESLSRLDEYATTQVATSDHPREKFAAVVENRQTDYTLPFGSYLGEVLVRQLDANWKHHDDGVHVTVPAGPTSTDVPVFDVALAGVVDEPQFAETVADLQESVDAVERDGADPAAHDSLRGVLLEEATELSAFWAEYDLDFSVESLSRLDDLVDENWEEARFREAEYGGETMDDRVMTGLVRQLGSYFGEVLVRGHDGRWVQNDGTAIQVRGDEDTATVDVFQIAEECLMEPSKFAFVEESLVRAVGDGDSRATVGGE